MRDWRVNGPECVRRIGASGCVGAAWPRYVCDSTGRVEPTHRPTVLKHQRHDARRLGIIHRVRTVFGGCGMGPPLTTRPCQIDDCNFPSGCIPPVGNNLAMNTAQIALASCTHITWLTAMRASMSPVTLTAKLLCPTSLVYEFAWPAPMSNDVMLIWLPRGLAGPSTCVSPAPAGQSRDRCWMKPPPLHRPATCPQQLHACHLTVPTAAAQ